MKISIHTELATVQCSDEPILKSCITNWAHLSFVFFFIIREKFCSDRALQYISVGVGTLPCFSHRDDTQLVGEYAMCSLLTTICTTTRWIIRPWLVLCSQSADSVLWCQVQSPRMLEHVKIGELSSISPFLMSYKIKDKHMSYFYEENVFSLSDLLLIHCNRF